MAMFGRRKDGADAGNGEAAPREASAEGQAAKAATRPEAPVAARPLIPEMPRRMPDYGAATIRRPEPRPEPRAETRPEARPEQRAEARPEPRPEPRSEARHEPRAAAAPSLHDNDGKKLIVGREIVLSGEIRTCDKLVVEGRVEATLTDSRSIEITSLGLYKGMAQVVTADIGGRFEGELEVVGRLTVRSTGKVSGNIRYGELEVEKGGVLTGKLDFATDARASAPAREGGKEARAEAGGKSEPMLELGGNVPHTGKSSNGKGAAAK